MPMLHAKRYEILRDVEANGRRSLPLAEKPVRVATLIDEAAFLGQDGLMQHNATVFFEDQFSDWQWRNGRFSYYSRVQAKGDVVVVYELERRPDPTPVTPDVAPTSARPLPLLDQMDFTSGLCSAFAIAAHRLIPEARLQVLISEDPRHLKTHDWPASMPMTVHAFVVLPDGRVLDAEGARTLVDLAASFGVRKTYRQRVQTMTPEELHAELPYREEWVLDALATMRRHGWSPTAALPEGTGELTRCWKATRKEQTARGPRPMPSLQAALTATWAETKDVPSTPCAGANRVRSPRVKP